MKKFGDIEALAFFEIDGMPRTIRAHDAALKRAPVRVYACAPISPGKALLLFGGDIASVEESADQVREIAASRLIDELLLPGIHPAVVTALTGERKKRSNEALAIVEVKTLATTLLAADAAVKVADVSIGRLHLGSGFDGKGYFTLWGHLYDVEAALESVITIGGERILDAEIIPAPHDELEDSLFIRPWPLDPAN